MLRSQVRDRYAQGKDVGIWDTEHLEIEAKLAASMCERWGMVAAEADGEDTAGRQKLKLSTPAGLVERAFAVSKLFMDRARKDGLVHTSPDMPPVEDREIGPE